MGKSQRTKGASYEREVCHEIGAALGIEVKRHIGQARDGGNDITVGPLVIECKRRKTLGTVYSWLQQAQAAIPSNTAGNIPVVVARQDQGQSLVILGLEDFLYITKHELRRRIECDAL